jgi:hypothetical protein
MASRPKSQPPRRPASVGELLDFLYPGVLGRSKCPAWPPDVFALTGTILRRTGLYVRVLDLSPEEGSRGVQRGWGRIAQDLGAAWRLALGRRLGSIRSSPSKEQLGKRLADLELPGEIEKCWRVVLRGSPVLLDELCSAERSGKGPSKAARKTDEICRALLKLCLVADEASAGMGIASRADLEADAFLRFSESPVLYENAFSSLCMEIHPEKVRVFPKQHTPQRGLTFRSLTHHLALCPANEVDIHWHAQYYTMGDRELESLNLLLLPWPLELTAREFRLLDDQPGLSELPSHHRLFGLRRSDRAEWFERYLDSAIRKAKNSVARVDAIVLPELALTCAEFEAAERRALEEKALLIAGVGIGPGDWDSDKERNVCVLQAGGFLSSAFNEGFREFFRVIQSKHHRWCLDRDQILQYGLGGMLPASRDCWESTWISRRSIQFATFGSWLTLSVLICEDLARQDPMSEILRAVGPNLVIALLMDGPQIRSRWPARYASVLAEDPGCSVLTLTSLGMSTRSRPRDGHPDRSRAIALWKDVWYGEQELELEEGCDAAVLSLVCRSFEEFSADGRGDGMKAHFPVFAGLHPLSTGENKSTKARARASRGSTRGKTTGTGLERPPRGR